MNLLLLPATHLLIKMPVLKMTPLIRGAFHLQRQLKLLFKQIRRFGSVACRLERKFKAERVDGENNEQ
jgi:hypothetical protein